MKSFARSALFTMLLALMGAVQQVESGAMFQIVAYHQSLPAQLVAELENKSYSTISYLQQFLENCTFAEPGGVLAGRRELWWEEEQVDEEQDGGEEMVAASQTPAARRELVGGCPSSCTNSGSKSCTQAGCAYCGKCGRRRGRTLQSTTATYLGSNGLPSWVFPLGVRTSAFVPYS
jgi:hypothetical protein